MLGRPGSTYSQRILRPDRWIKRHRRLAPRVKQRDPITVVQSLHDRSSRGDRHGRDRRPLPGAGPARRLDLHVSGSEASRAALRAYPRCSNRRRLPLVLLGGDRCAPAQQCPDSRCERQAGSSFEDRHSRSMVKVRAPDDPEKRPCSGDTLSRRQIAPGHWYTCGEFEGLIGVKVIRRISLAQPLMAGLLSVT